MLTSTDSVDLNGQPFKVYPERWSTLAHFFVLQMTNSLMWVTFAPIADIAADFFGGDGFEGTLTAINLLAVLFLVLYPFGTVIAAYTKRMYGLRISLLIAAYFTVFGALLRFVGVYVRNNVGGRWSYALVFIGTMFVAIIQPIYINYPPTVSAIWFPLTERDIATSIGSMSNPVGNAIGTLIPVFIVRRTTNNGKVIHGMATLMLVEFLATLVPLILAAFLLQNSPPTPPSHSESLKITELSVHSVDGIRSAIASSDNTSITDFTPQQAQISPLQQPPQSSATYQIRGDRVTRTVAGAREAKLSQADFGHDMSDDDAVSFAASPPSPHSSPLTSTQSSTHLMFGRSKNMDTRDSSANNSSGNNRGSSFWSPSRFSIFANADRGPIRYKAGSVRDDIRSLFRNKDYVILLVTMSFLLGMFSAFLTVLYQLISHYGYSNREAGILGFVVIIAGLLGTVVIGFIMKRTRAYRSLLQTIVILAVIFFIITMVVMTPGKFPGLVVCMILLGITLLPVLPVMMENCAEIAYPISEELSTGIVFSLSNIVGLVFIFIVQVLIPRSHYHHDSPVAEVKIFMGAVIIAAAIIVLFYRGTYLRLAKDLTKKDKAAAAAAAEEFAGRRSRASSFGEKIINRLRRKSKSMYGKESEDEEEEEDEEENGNDTEHTGQRTHSAAHFIASPPLHDDNDTAASRTSDASTRGSSIYNPKIAASQDAATATNHHEKSPYQNHNQAFFPTPASGTQTQSQSNNKEDFQSFV